MPEIKNKTNVWNYIAVFLLGIFVAVNIFFGVSYYLLKGEIAKLKADDLTLAQAINTLSTQLGQLSGGQISGPMIQTGDEAANQNANTNPAPTNTNQ